MGRPRGALPVLPDRSAPSPRRVSGGVGRSVRAVAFTLFCLTLFVKEKEVFHVPDRRAARSDGPRAFRWAQLDRAGERAAALGRADRARGEAGGGSLPRCR